MADEKLSEAEDIDLKAIEEREAITDRRRASAADSRAARGDAARLRFDYRTAAAHFAAAVTWFVAIWTLRSFVQARRLRFTIKV